MEDGILAIIMDGLGFQAMSGGQLGLVGEPVADITDGLHWDQV
jgi:hypothetical protein